MQFKSAVIAVAVATLFALPAFCQTDFQNQPYVTPYDGSATLTAQNDLEADFNGDGLADVLVADPYTVSSSTCGATCLYLYINNGNGLDAPVLLHTDLQTEANVETRALVAVADLNGDGKLDIAALNAGNGITILYGNGDGTFQAPVYITLPSEQYTAIATGDFDVNGTPDLVALDQHGHVQLLFNDGKGNFTQQRVWEDQTLPSGYLTQALAVGDFNGDGRPDIAWVEDGDGGSQENTVWTALNTGKGTFSAKKELGTLPAGYGYIRSADLDLDGKGDLITWTSQMPDYCCTALPVTAYYSNGDGTFTAKSLTNSSLATQDVGVSDINGDGYRDVLIASQNGVGVYTGNGDRTFTFQGTYTSLAGGAMQVGFGFFDTTNRVGFVAPNENPMGESNGNEENGFYLVSNDNAQGDCAYPASAGVTFCESMQNGNAALVRGTARAQTQPVERIELWANGKKLYQVFADEFDTTLDVAPGTQITAVEVEANGATKSASVTPSSAQTCSAPSSPGVNVCAPTPGENTTSPVNFRAAGRGASGTVNHLELWIDGKKVGNYSGATMDASVTVATGSHSAQVVEVDSKGAYVKSAVVSFTVGGQTGACAAPSSAGVHVCAPTAGESSASPVSFLAAGTGASGAVNHLELWIDGKKVGNYSGSKMDASVGEAAGSHTATVIEVDSKGNYVKSSPVSYTVK